jgi:ribosomal protein S18 acetylase RimI-like enzyme
MMLRTMTLAEYDAWLAPTITSYAQSLARAEGWPAQRAEDESKESFYKLLPDGLATAGQLLWSIVHEGAVVGSLWMGPHPELSDAFWIWGIAIDAQYRSRGIGRNALIEADEAARKLGGRRIELNVFDDNPAVRLYERLGYTLVKRKRGSSTMGKDL